MSAENFSKLQQIQNNAARLVMKKRKRVHITPVLKHLHWLPVKARVDYKICVIIYQCLNDQIFPYYLKELIEPYTPARCLRTATENLLRKPRTRLRHYGDRAFTSSGPAIWNELPSSLRKSDSLETFKRNLKTFLFTKYLN